jgi:type VI protein secretion system component Hcp
MAIDIDEVMSMIRYRMIDCGAENINRVSITLEREERIDEFTTYTLKNNIIIDMDEWKRMNTHERKLKGVDAREDIYKV